MHAEKGISRRFGDTTITVDKTEGGKSWSKKEAPLPVVIHLTTEGDNVITELKLSVTNNEPSLATFSFLGVLSIKEFELLKKKHAARVEDLQNNKEFWAWLSTVTETLQKRLQNEIVEKNQDFIRMAQVQQAAKSRAQ